MHLSTLGWAFVTALLSWLGWIAWQIWPWVLGTSTA